MEKSATQIAQLIYYTIVNNKVNHLSEYFPGDIVIVGFGSIGKAITPLIRRHLRLTDRARLIVLCPETVPSSMVAEFDLHAEQVALSEDNYKFVLKKYVGKQKRRGLVINVANEVSSADLADFCALNNSHYIDTVVEPWPGFYFSKDESIDKSNYGLRESFLNLKKRHHNTPTAISCCGANPGMVSWLVKDALLLLANKLGHDVEHPRDRKSWGYLMMALGVKGIHIAERDTQARKEPKLDNEFVNTWSVEGLVAEGLQPAELGWGTHEKMLPDDGMIHDYGCGAAIYLKKPGATVKVQTWTPDHGNHFGYLITHNEAISIADYFTVKEESGKVKYRPTCHYAYHPTNDTVMSIKELLEYRKGEIQDKKTILTSNNIIDGSDQLGVLLYGHSLNAMWHGSTLSINETRELAPYQNATGLQVSSAILAAIFYCIKNPNLGILETDDLDHNFCLNIQKPYLGKISTHYTDWHPEPKNDSDPWQFSNVRIDKN